MIFDFKITVWERLEIFGTDNDEITISEKMKAGVFTSQSDVIEWLEDEGIVYEISSMADTTEELTPKENAGASTIEIMQDDKINGGYTKLWENGEI